MKGIIRDLKGFRAKNLNGMSQNEFARILGISHDKVSRIEAEPEKTSLDILEKISVMFGISLDELVGTPDQTCGELQVTDTWRDQEKAKARLMSYLDKWREQPDATALFSKWVSEFKALNEEAYRKPLIVFTGEFSSGKSTMINSILGVKALSNSVISVTNIPFLLCHADDRPPHIKDDVVLLSSSVTSFRDALSREDNRSGIIASGSYSILDSGEYTARNDVAGAIIFSESSVLRDCDILEYSPDPFLMDASTVQLVGPLLSTADAVIYTIAMTHPITVSMLSSLSRMAGQRPPDSPLVPGENFLIVITKAQLADGTAGVDRFIDDVKTAVTEIGVFREKDEKEKDDAAQWIFPYSTNSEQMQARFNEEFRYLVEFLPLETGRRAASRINALRCLRVSEIERRIQFLRNEAHICSDNEKLTADLKRTKKDLAAFVRDTCYRAETDFDSYWHHKTSSKEIGKRMEIERLKTRQEIEFFVNRLLEEVKLEAAKIMKKGEDRITEYTIQLVRLNLTQTVCDRQSIISVAECTAITPAEIINIVLPDRPSTALEKIYDIAAQMFFPVIRTYTGTWLKNAAKQISENLCSSNTLRMIQADIRGALTRVSAKLDSMINEIYESRTRETALPDHSARSIADELRAAEDTEKFLESMPIDA